MLGLKWGEKLPFLSDFMIKIKSIVDKRPNLKVYIILDPPYAEEANRQGVTDPLRHVTRLPFINGASNFTINLPTQKLWENGNNKIKEIFGTSATYLDPSPVVWPNGSCNILHWYKDDDHLQPSRLEKEGIWLDPVFIR